MQFLVIYDIFGPRLPSNDKYSSIQLLGNSDETRILISSLLWYYAGGFVST